MMSIRSVLFSWYAVWLPVVTVGLWSQPFHAQPSHAQPSHVQPSRASPVDHVVGSTYSIRSQALEQDRKIQVYLPESYGDASQRYSVLYVLDGQRYFLHGIAYQKAFVRFKKTPEFIVVGIDTSIPQRRRLIDLQASQFEQFLEHEVIAFVDGQFRTSQDRILFGWERAGGFAAQILGENPDLFNAYFLASPDALVWRVDPAAETRLKMLEGLLSQDQEKGRFLYVTRSDKEPWLEDSLGLLADLLEEKAPKDFNWKIDQLEGEDHWTTSHRTIHRGLRMYFRDYEPLQFRTLQEFHEFGGFDRVVDFYARRGRRYDVSSEIHDVTQHGLLVASIREDNFEAFEKFMEVFSGYLNLTTRPIWGSRFGQFYLKHGHVVEALEVLTRSAQRFPDSAKLQNSLGDAHRAAGQTEQAAMRYRKAVDLAKEAMDPELVEFQANLADLQQ